MKDLAKKKKEDPEFHIGDIVYYSKFAYPDSKGIIIAFSHLAEQSVASVYTREYDVPQIVPLKDLTPTGQHLNVLDFFNKAFIDIQEVDKNGNT